MSIAIEYASRESSNRLLHFFLPLCCKRKRTVPETIFTEYISGMKENKVELQKLLNVIRSGDIFAVTELSRLTRSTKQLCDIIETVKNKQIKLIIKDSITIDCTNGTLDPMTAAFLQITGISDAWNIQ